jgi:hypothetical protein
LFAVGIVTLVLGAAAIAGCAVPDRRCAPIAPNELPNGMPAGDRADVVREGRTYFVWGAGDARVTQVVGLPVFDPEELAARGEGAPIDVRGSAGRAQAIGDAPLGEVAFAWSIGSCAYTVWIGSGFELPAVVEYANEY